MQASLPWVGSLRLLLGGALLAGICLTARAQPTTAATDYQVYALKHKPVADVERALSAMLSGYGTAVHLVSDARSGRILVRGPEPAQQVARQVIETIDQPTDPAEAAGSASRKVIRLSQAGNAHIEPIVREVFGTRLKSQPAGESHRSDYQLTDTAGRVARIEFNRQRSEVTIAAPAPLLNRLAHLIQALDNPPASSGSAVRVVPIRRANPAQIREAAEALRSGRPRTEQPPSNPKPPDGSARSRAPQDVHLLCSTIRPGTGHTGLIAYLFQPSSAESPPPAAGVERIPTVDPEKKEPLPREPLREPNTDVEVEILPDLDAIILRGRQRDVEQLRRIIEEIERLSAQTQPVIDVYLLRHVNCELLATLIQQASPDLLDSKQGRVSITPLVKPNALLLIGWGEAVGSIKELIARLDQPVSPETQFRVFRLRSAAAAAMASTVQGFFAGRTGLAAQARVIADTRTNALIVQAAPRDMAEVALLIERLDQPQGEAVRQARLFKLANSLAADVAGVLQAAIGGARAGTAGAAAPATGQKTAALELLTLDDQQHRMIRAGVLDDVQITPDVRTNTLIVAAPAESMPLLAELIRQLDSPAAVAQIKVFRITNGDAATQVNMLRALLPASAGAGPAGANMPTLPGAEGETSLVPVRFSIDTRTNSIIAVGSQGDLAIIEALLIRLDQDQGQQRKNAVYRLKNAPASDVARAINEFLGSERRVQQVVPGILSPFQQIESEVVVVPEIVSNALIISATPRFFDDIRELVEKLDAEPPQVVIQVLIAEVSLSNTDEFGVELGLQDGLLFDRSLLGNLITTTTTAQQSTPSGIITATQQNIVSATNEPGYDFNQKLLGNSGSNQAVQNRNLIGPQGLSNFSVGRINDKLGFGGLVLSASSESVSVLIRALQESHRLRVLSRPQVMTLDNQPAFVQVGKRVPRITGSAINQIGQQNQLMLENVGIILGVTPRISPDNRVVMEVDAEKSEVGPVDEGIPVSSSGNVVIKSPSINLTTAQTTVSALDGETIIIGGLITKSEDKLDRRVPWLSDLPLLGVLFRYNAVTRQRTEMLIILTPYIVRSPEDAERVRKAEEARMHWCLGDVTDVHGLPAVATGHDEAQVPVVYPDRTPRGGMPKSKNVLPPLPEEVPQGLPAPVEPNTRSLPPVTPNPGPGQPPSAPLIAAPQPAIVPTEPRQRPLPPAVGPAQPILSDSSPDPRAVQPARYQEAPAWSR